jgi:hypothetical protein
LLKAYFLTEEWAGRTSRWTLQWRKFLGRMSIKRLNKDLQFAGIFFEAIDAARLKMASFVVFAGIMEEIRKNV